MEERELGQGGDGSAAEQGRRWLWILPPMEKEEETGALKLIVVPMRKKKRYRRREDEVKERGLKYWNFFKKKSI